MVTFLKQNIAREIPFSFGIGVVDPVFVALQADLDTVVSMKKNAEDVLTEGTNDVNDAAGSALVDIDNAVNFGEIDSGTVDFVKGDSKGLTGIRITPLGVPGTAVITGTVTQYKQRVEVAKQ